MTTIINNRPNVYTIGAVRLMPGPNEVDDKLAGAFLKHKAAQERIKIGHLTVTAPPKTVKADAPAMPKGDDK